MLFKTCADNFLKLLVKIGHVNKLTFLYIPKKVIPASKINALVQGKDFWNDLSKEEKAEIDKNWALLEKQGLFSKPAGIGSLVDATNPNNLLYRPADFKTFAVLFKTASKKTFRKKLYSEMRTSCLGVAIILADETVVVQKRAKTLFACPGMWDSSVAGYCHNEKGKLDFLKAVYEKLARELNILTEDVKQIHFSGIHNSSAPELTGSATFNAFVNLSKTEIKRRANAKYVAELKFVHIRNIPRFCYEHFVEKKDIVGDGCATLLRALSDKEFKRAVEMINSKGKRIMFGTLKNGILKAEEGTRTLESQGCSLLP